MNAQLLMTRYWKYIAEQDAEKLRPFFHENAFIRWHCTNEHFTVSEFLRANCEYPGDWKGEVERIEQIGNTVITVTHVWSEEMSSHAVSFFKMEQDKIMSIDEYWGDDGEIPQWRLDKHIGSKIH
ncbi:MAG: nuclear transport factor 2 family protein [Lacrimispora sp.]